MTVIQPSLADIGSSADRIALIEPLDNHPEPASLKLDFQKESVYFDYLLPTEILEAIFTCCAADYTDSGSQIPTVPSWVNVTYVSRRWRHVALNFAPLWSHLFFSSPRWTKELLARSKQEPLKLQVNLYCNGKKQVMGMLEQVMRHVERIQELQIKIPFGFPSYEVFSISEFHSPAPRLQTLKILIGYPSLSPYLRLFDGKTPALRTLELSSCGIPFDSPTLSSTTTLSLCRACAILQDAKSFLASLVCSQVLRYLYLDNTLRPAVQVPWRVLKKCRHFQKVDLPHLSRLLIVGPLSTVTEFLSSVNIPSKAQVRLDISGKEDDSDGWTTVSDSDSDSESSPSSVSPTPSEPGKDNYALLYSLLAQRFAMSEDQAFPSPIIRSLTIIFREDGDVKLIFSAASGRTSNLFVFTSFATWDWDRSIPLEIVVQPDHCSAMEHIVSDICCSLPLSSVESVHVINPPPSSAFWKEILGHLDLRYLRVSEGDVRDLVSVLRVGVEDRGGDANPGPNQIYAPVLEELELRDVALEEDVVQSLCDALSTRRGPRSRLTWWNSKHQEILEMVGRWEDGSFQVVEKPDGTL